MQRPENFQRFQYIAGMDDTIYSLHMYTPISCLSHTHKPTSTLTQLQRPEDFQRFQYIVGMDDNNMRAILVSH